MAISAVPFQATVRHIINFIITIFSLRRRCSYDGGCEHAANIIT